MKVRNVYGPRPLTWNERRQACARRIAATEEGISDIATEMGYLQDPALRKARADRYSTSKKAHRDKRLKQLFTRAINAWGVHARFHTLYGSES